MCEKKYNSIAVIGPTASGKTSIAAYLAYKFSGEIISADSRQVYCGLDIGSGKDLEEYCVNGINISYHLINITDLSQEYSVFNYQKDFYKVFPEIISRNKLPIIAGGSGMYLDSVLRNYNLVKVPENNCLRAQIGSKSLEELQKILLELKPDYHTKQDLYDKNRMLRAIEIAVFMNNLKTPEAETPPFINPLILGVFFERSKLRENILIRLKKRLNEGMIEETENLHKQGFSWERLEKLGLEYRFCALYLQNKIYCKEELLEKLNIAIRQFAKRQETWFSGMEKKGIKIHRLPCFQDKQEMIEAAVKTSAAFFEKAN